jgi:hypothetical protein
MFANIDIPFLDIALIPNGNVGKKYSKIDVVDIEKSKIIPIARVDYILNDLNKTYTTPYMAAARYWNDKTAKDIHRYRILENTKFEANDSNSMEIDYTDDILDAVVDDDHWKYMEDNQNLKNSIKYADFFKHIIKKDKNKYKYKMPFTYPSDKLDNISDLKESTEMDID